MIVFTDAPTDQDTEGGDDVSPEEVTCGTTHVKVMLQKYSAAKDFNK